MSARRRASGPAAVSTTVVFDSYWRMAAERLAMFYRRYRGDPGPWTKDPILTNYRFTNTYRAADRVTQYLIREVQYHPDRSQSAEELFFRTVLFKIFNRIETWEALERANGPLSWSSVSLEALDLTLSQLMERGERIYSAAYIMPAPPYGAARKHSNHLRLISEMMTARLPERLRQAPTLRSVYESILSFPGLGPFLAFQYSVDLNYSEMLAFDESDFVVAGPGAMDGIAKCFSSTGGRTAEEIIYWVTERQEEELSSRGLNFPGLFGRRLQPIDCQNLFCEIAKYARVAHPDIRGASNRQRIKQNYRRTDVQLPLLSFPPRWKLTVGEAGAPEPRQRSRHSVSKRQECGGHALEPAQYDLPLI